MVLLCNLRNLRNLFDGKNGNWKGKIGGIFFLPPNIFITCNNHRFNDYCNRKIFSKLFYFCSATKQNLQKKLIQFLFGNKLKNKSNFHKNEGKTFFRLNFAFALFSFFFPYPFFLFWKSEKRKSKNSLKPTTLSEISPIGLV